MSMNDCLSPAHLHPWTLEAVQKMQKCIENGWNFRCICHTQQWAEGLLLAVRLTNQKNFIFSFFWRRTLLFRNKNMVGIGQNDKNILWVQQPSLSQMSRSPSQVGVNNKKKHVEYYSPPVSTNDNFLGERYMRLSLQVKITTFPPFDD